MSKGKLTGKAAILAAAICVTAALPSFARDNRNWVGGGDTDLDGRTTSATASASPANPASCSLCGDGDSLQATLRRETK